MSAPLTLEEILARKAAGQKTPKIVLAVEEYTRFPGIGSAEPAITVRATSEKEAKEKIEAHLAKDKAVEAAKSRGAVAVLEAVNTPAEALVDEFVAEFEGEMIRNEDKVRDPKLSVKERVEAALPPGVKVDSFHQHAEVRPVVGHKPKK